MPSDRPTPHVEHPPASNDHAHVHSHEMEGGWERWQANPVLRALLALLFVIAVAVLWAMAAMWPDGSGRADVNEQAETFGLVSERYEATVDSLSEDECPFSTEGNEWDCLTVVVVPADGPDAGSLLALPEFIKDSGQPLPPIEAGDQIIIDYVPETDFYSYADQDRRGTLLLLTALFALVVVVLGRLRGVRALAAMALTVIVLVGFVAPSVLDGNDPVVVSVVAAAVIAFGSLYLTHGVTPTTTVALIGTLLALLLTLVLSVVFFDLAGFTGTATEEGLVLPIVAENINMASLLLGGAIIGALGALDDVTVTQVATVAELRHQRSDLDRRQLFTAGIRVGREHIAATVNTLLLAYAGVSMPLLLLFVISNQPLDLIANSELVAIEIVRTLCGSMGLIAAVPITTWLTAVLVASETPDEHAEASEAVSDPDDDTADEIAADKISTDEITVDTSAEEAAASDTADQEPRAETSTVPDESDIRWDDFGPSDDWP